MRRDIEKFQKSITLELYTIKNRVRELIGDANWGEEGRYKESMLKNVLKRFLPSNFSIGTGFIVSSEEATDNTRSSQIDIIIYDNSYPLLFNDGDFIVTSPESVKAIIEVKTALNNGRISRVLETANKNGRIASESVFNGVFVYEQRELTIEENVLNPELNESLIQSNGEVNHLCIGKDIFFKYWDSQTKKEQQFDRLYSYYRIKNLAYSYFISNLIECIAPDKVKDKSWFLYPIRNKFGKEGHWLNDVRLSANDSTSNDVLSLKK
ncbi:DUF6602 domain-containing protein [Halobacillus faecis]